MKALWNRLITAVGWPLLLVIVLLGGYFAYTFIRDWETSHAIAEQNKRIDDFTAKSVAAQEDTERRLAQYDQQHEQTLSLIDTIKDMSTNIKLLADNDKVITGQVQDLKRNYETSRTQKISSVSARDRVPLRQREDDVLSADRQLYNP